ncbi:MAG: paaC, partial [Rhodoferax sp.]|nr:paaC [Rhodoferax sp.]
GTIATAAPDAVPPVGSSTAPGLLLVEGDLGAAAPLLALAQGAGWQVSGHNGEGILRIDGVGIALTDGRSATARMGVDVVFDLAFDYAAAPLVALAVADQAPLAALATATDFFHSLGKRVVQLDDAPGLVVMRTVAMLANEGAEVVQQSIATPFAVDLAMTKGVNYPVGPLAWADAVGINQVCTVMANLAAVYGEDRYRLSPLLQRMRCAGRTFYPAPSQELVT